jgi:hypothetical protein
MRQQPSTRGKAGLNVKLTKRTPRIVAISIWTITCYVESMKIHSMTQICYLNCLVKLYIYWL